MKFVITITLCLIAFTAFAQPSSPAATPIDGGLCFLLAAGSAYGIKKIRDFRKRNN